MSPKIVRTRIALCSALAMATLASAGAHAADAPGQPDAQMAAVLEAQRHLGWKPIPGQSVEAARSGPTVGMGENEVLAEAHKSIDPMPVGSIDNIEFATDDKSLVKARVYKPKDAGDEKLPVIVYWHGGGWVIGSLDAYDATPRELANGAHAVVVSCDYREGPEHKFPAAHTDALYCYEFVTKNMDKWNGDASRIAVAGESAGGNMAAEVAIEARNRHMPLPLYQLLIYPVAGGGFDQASYLTYANQQPLDTPTVQWMLKNYTSSPADAQDPRLAIVNQPDLTGLPPATVITAEIDPLNSEGRAYARKLMAAGVPVNYRNFGGVTHEFFSLGRTVERAKQAEDIATADLRAAFAHEKVAPSAETP